MWESRLSGGRRSRRGAAVRDQGLSRTLSAVHVHRGPIEDLATAWPQMIEWLLSKGYAPVGPATQVFKGDLAAAPEVEMQMPVK